MSYSLNHLLSQINRPELLHKAIHRLKRFCDRVGKSLRIMEFCGGHTHSILRYGLDEALSPEIEFVHGPGCPVCVLDVDSLEYALLLAKTEGSIFTTYGDLLRVPSPRGLSLQILRGEGFDIKMISNSMDALRLAKEQPNKTIIFFAFGFETTAPATAFLLTQAKAFNMRNLKVISNHLLTPPVLDFLFSKHGVFVDGIIGPGHVSAVIGADAYRRVAEGYGLPFVVAGFEPMDILDALITLVEMLEKGKIGVSIAYRRAVSFEGNHRAKALMDEVFTVRETFPWRGLGFVPESGFAISEKYAEFDGERIWERPRGTQVPTSCICGKILQGKAKPVDCPLYRNKCRPESPIGPCMVSSEGACSAYYRYKLT